jgi:hypothetical protein
VVEGEDNLGYTPAGIDREADPVATVPEAGAEIRAQGTVVPIYNKGQILDKAI